VAAFHKQEAMHYKGIAEAETPRHTGYVMDSNRQCHSFEYPLTEAEMMELKPIRERACRRVAYHLALQRKYERAASFPWLPVTPDPSEPQ